MVICACLFLVLLPMGFAGAGFEIMSYVNQIIGAVLTFLIRTVLMCIVWIAGIFDAFVQGVWARDSGMVDLGWGLVKDLMNMGFILVMLTIAFATIFKIQAYSVKALLPKLLIAILLINFSKHICYVVVDFAEVLMFSMSNSENITSLGRAKSFSAWKDLEGYNDGSTDATQMWAKFDSRYKQPKGQHGIGMALVYALGLPQLDISLAASRLDTNQADGSKFHTGDFIVQLAMIFLFSLYIAFVILGLLVLFVGRKIGIWMYTIFSPYAFWTFTVPFLRSHLSKWWSKFGGIVFMGPVAMFYIYLASNFMVKSLATNLEPIAINGNNVERYFEAFPIGQLNGDAMFITIVVLVLLTMAIGTGKKMGIATAGFVESMGKKIQGGITKRLKKGASRIGSAAWSGTKGAVSATAMGTRRVLQGTQDKVLSQWKGAQERRSERKKEVAESQKNLEGLSSDTISGSLNQFKSTLLGRMTRKQRNDIGGRLNELSKRGELDKAIVTDSKGGRSIAGFNIDTKEGADKLMKFADFIGADSKAMMNAMPELSAAGISKSDANASKRVLAIKEKIKKGEGKKISKSSLSDFAVAGALSLNQIRNINKEGSVDQQEALVGGMGKALDMVYAGHITGQDGLSVIRNAKNLALDSMKARGEHTRGIEKDFDKYKVKFENGNFVLIPPAPNVGPTQQPAPQRPPRNQRRP